MDRKDQKPALLTKSKLLNNSTRRQSQNIHSQPTTQLRHIITTVRKTGTIKTIIKTKPLQQEPCGSRTN